MTKFYTNAVMVPVDLIEPNPWNPNEMEAEITTTLGALLEEFGLFGGIPARQLKDKRGKLIDRYQIVDGEQRFKRLVAAGDREIPLTVIPDLSEDEAKTLTLALNNLRGEHNVVKLAAMFRTMQNPQLLAKFSGYTPHFLAKFADAGDINWSELLSASQSNALAASMDTVRFAFALPRKEGEAVRAAMQAIAAEHGLSDDEQVLLYWAQGVIIPSVSQWRNMVFSVHADQAEVINRAIDLVADQLGGKNARGQALEMIAADYLAGLSEIQVKATGAVQITGRKSQRPKAANSRGQKKGKREMKKPVAKSGKINLRQISKLYREILIAIGEDAEREGLRGTPDRCARVWAEFINYDPGNTDVTFETIDTDQMIAVSDIEAWSFCEHHLLPFRCSIAIGIVPESKRVLGLSKYARVALQHAHRLQIQERLTGQIADEIQALTHCRSVAVVIDGQHLCAVMRGVKSNNTMHTAAMRGSFMESAEARAEFYRLIRRTV